MSRIESLLTQACIDAALGSPARARSIQVVRVGWVDRHLAQAHPALPGLLYAPVALACGAWSAARIGAARATTSIALGWLVFSLFEYVLHRFVFHRVFAPTRAGRIRAFLTHGYHHAYPDDPRRLVMPPLISLPIATAFAVAERLAAGPAAGAALFAGSLVGYVAYDTGHWLFHHARWSNPAFVWLRRYHLLHHHADSPGRYGVSTPLWDVVFGTFGAVPPRRR
jgi:sterol desaturase/sphingolipid hydroxylase (fatty acid hydroxylase superfamily)